jgi:hypothetical protein
LEQESTKVEAESDRGASATAGGVKIKKLKVKKSRVTGSVDNNNPTSKSTKEIIAAGEENTD